MLPIKIMSVKNILFQIFLWMKTWIHFYKTHLYWSTFIPPSVSLQHEQYVFFFIKSWIFTSSLYLQYFTPSEPHTRRKGQTSPPEIPPVAGGNITQTSAYWLEVLPGNGSLYRINIHYEELFFKSFICLLIIYKLRRNMRSDPLEI